MPEIMTLWDGGPRFIQARTMPLSTDSVLLADFTRASQRKKCIDLGCASGILSLLLLTKSPALSAVSLEIDAETSALCAQNMALNNLDKRCECVCGDILKVRERFKSGSFDLAVTNPPYFPLGRGKLPEDEKRAAARGEIKCSLRDVCAAASYLLCTGGSFNIVIKPERLSELMCLMSELGLEPKRLRLVSHSSGRAPSLALIEGRRGGKPGLSIEPELILCDENGAYTPEANEIYHLC